MESRTPYSDPFRVPYLRSASIHRSSTTLAPDNAVVAEAPCRRLHRGCRPGGLVPPRLHGPGLRAAHVRTTMMLSRSACPNLWTRRLHFTNMYASTQRGQARGGRLSLADGRSPHGGGEEGGLHGQRRKAGGALLPCLVVLIGATRSRVGAWICQVRPALFSHTFYPSPNFFFNRSTKKSRPTRT